MSLSTFTLTKEKQVIFLLLYFVNFQVDVFYQNENNLKIIKNYKCQSGSVFLRFTI